MRRYLAIGMGAFTLFGAGFLLSGGVSAQGKSAARHSENIALQEQAAEPGPVAAQQEQGGFGGPGGGGFGGPGGGFGGPGGGGFGGPGGGPGFGGPMMGGPGGGPTMTANATRVFVLQGGTLYAYDAATMKLAGQATLPRPQGPQGGPEGGFGGPGGGPGFGGGGRRQRPGQGGGGQEQ